MMSQRGAQILSRLMLIGLGIALGRGPLRSTQPPSTVCAQAGVPTTPGSADSEAFLVGTSLSQRRTPPLISPAACTARYKTAAAAAQQLRGEFRMMIPVLAKLKDVCGGTFVELGANNGVNSHSKFLEEQLGWRGACIEAAPNNFEALVKARPECDNIHAVVWHTSEEVTFRACTGKLYGHSGLVSMRSDTEWKVLMNAHRGKFTCTDHSVAARPAPPPSGLYT